MSMEEVFIINKKVKNLIDSQSSANENLLNTQTNSINNNVNTKTTSITNNVNSKISSQTTSINNNTNLKTNDISNKIGTANTSVANESTIFNYLKKILNTVSTFKPIKSYQYIDTIINISGIDHDYTDFTISSVNISNTILIPAFYRYMSSSGIVDYSYKLIAFNKLRVYHRCGTISKFKFQLQIIQFNN